MSYKKSYKKSNDENNLEDFTEVELQGKHDLLKAQSVMKWLENMENLLDLLLSQGCSYEKDIKRQMYFVCNTQFELRYDIVNWHLLSLHLHFTSSPYWIKLYAIISISTYNNKFVKT